MASDIELKPCPFCGNENPVKEELATGVVFRCMNGDCFVRPCTRPQQTEKKAAAAWNRRAEG